MILYFLIYLAAVNAVTFVLFWVDKHRAVLNGTVAKRNRAARGKKHYTEKRRIPEKTLLVSAALGGSVGGIAGMWLFHHKTRHWYFVWGLPAMLLLQLLIAWIAVRGL